MYLITDIMRIKGVRAIKEGLRRKLNSDTMTSAELNFVLFNADSLCVLIMSFVMFI